MLERGLFFGPKFRYNNINSDVANRVGLCSNFGKHLTTPNSMSYFMVSCRICDKNLDKENASNHMKDHDRRGEIPLIRTKIASSDNAA